MKEKEHNSYIGSLIHGITSLLTGMKTTMTVFWRKKTTEQYPENRNTLKLSERFRGTLTMPHKKEPVTAHAKSRTIQSLMVNKN